MALLKQNLLKSKKLSLVLLIALLWGLPFSLTVYRLEIAVTLLTNIILVLSFRVIVTVGDWNFGHAALTGAGAYATALIAKNLGWPVWVILPLAGLIAALVGLILSYPLLKMRGFYYFMGSFAAAEAVRLCWIKFRYPFGGPPGILNIPPPSFLGIDLEGVSFYFLVLVVATLCVMLMYRLDKSRIGDTFKAIRSGESLSRSIGINITRYRALAFVIGSFFAGIAGVFMAYRVGTVDPSQYAGILTLFVFIWAVVGGTSTVAGPIIGVVVLGLIEESIRTTFVEWMPLIYGAILILTVLFLPEGLESLPRRISARFKGRVKEPTS